MFSAPSRKFRVSSRTAAIILRAIARVAGKGQGNGQRRRGDDGCYGSSPFAVSGLIADRPKDGDGVRRGFAIRFDRTGTRRRKERHEEGPSIAKSVEVRSKRTSCEEIFHLVPAPHARRQKWEWGRRVNQTRACDSTGRFWRGGGHRWEDGRWGRALAPRCVRGDGAHPSGRPRRYLLPFARGAEARNANRPRNRNLRLSGGDRTPDGVVASDAITMECGLL